MKGKKIKYDAEFYVDDAVPEMAGCRGCTRCFFQGR
jgi:hypothetical protein